MGHGWVTPNPDGSKARCGGPTLCSVCQQELRAKQEFQALPPEGRLGDAPVEAELHAMMRALAKGIDKMLNGEAEGGERKVGFVLLTFPFGEAGGRCNYVSNGADRRDIATMLREQARRFEGAPDPGVGHG